MTTTVTDPVCGMQVTPEVARAQDFVSEHGGQTYLFCSRGCKLNFDEDPARILSPDYEPSM